VQFLLVQRGQFDQIGVNGPAHRSDQLQFVINGLERVQTIFLLQRFIGDGIVVVIVTLLIGFAVIVGAIVRHAFRPQVVGQPLAVSVAAVTFNQLPLPFLVVHVTVDDVLFADAPRTADVSRTRSKSHPPDTKHSFRSSLCHTHLPATHPIDEYHKN
jgi:hypothetical protein